MSAFLLLTNFHGHKMSKPLTNFAKESQQSIPLLFRRKVVEPNTICWRSQNRPISHGAQVPVNPWPTHGQPIMIYRGWPVSSQSVLISLTNL